MDFYEKTAAFIFDVFQNRLVYFRRRLCDAAAAAGRNREKRRWATDEELLDLYSIGQCTPGIISVNVATFMGYRQAGIAGACAATLGMVMPSLIIITLLAAVLDRYMHNRYVSYAFAGIRICVVALILDIIYDLWKRELPIIRERGFLRVLCCCSWASICLRCGLSYWPALRDWG